MEVSGAGAFAESLEVQDVALLLRALGDPQDAVALVGVLARAALRHQRSRSCSSGSRPAAGSASLRSRDAATLRGHPVAQALQTLSLWFRWTHVLPIAAAIERILEDSGYLALAATTPAGVEAGDLLHAVDRVRQVAERGGSLADAADALEADLEAVGDVESLPLEPGRTDVVRADEPAQGQGARGPRRVPCRSVRRAIRRRQPPHRARRRGGTRLVCH